MLILLAALAGGLGAIARFAADGAIQRHNPTRLPLGTLLVNLTGSFALGLLTGWAMSAGDAAGPVKLVLGTGFLGGYTTFSAASVEVVRLLLERRPAGAVLHAVAMLAGGIGLAALGLALTWH